MSESMRAYGYTLSTAVADLIDNSIAARCTTVWLHFEWTGADSWMILLDDGHGMSETELSNAMKLGSRSPLESRDAEDLGRFGLGLKTASLSQCRRLSVVTRQPGGANAARRWDLDFLSRPDVQGWKLLTALHQESAPRVAPLDDLDHGTLVLWECLDRIVGNAGKDDRKIRRHFLRLVEDVESHLSMVFHRFLAGPHPRLKICVNGNRLTGWDPFLVGHRATQATPEEEIRLPGHSEPIRVKGFILPHKDRLGDMEHARASGPAGWNAQQGFYLYRNERLIVPGSWLGLGAGRPWTKEEHYKLARIRLDIPNSMDHLWHLDVKKSSAQPPPVVADRLKGLAQKVRQDARSVFAHRGKYGKRKTKQEYSRPWKATRKGGVVVYRIDRNHPVLKALIGSVPKSSHDELEAALVIIEETVPVEQIWLDTAEHPDDPAPAFHGSTSSRIRGVIALAYRALRRNRGCSHEEAIDRLLAAEEFAGEEAQAIIATLHEEK
jgi:hypothetical protein